MLEGVQVCSLGGKLQHGVCMALHVGQQGKKAGHYSRCLLLLLLQLLLLEEQLLLLFPGSTYSQL